MKQALFLLVYVLIIYSCSNNEQDIEITSISFDSTEITIGTNETSTLGIKHSPSDKVLPPITWTSQSPDIATVDSNGIVHGIKPGSTKITVTLKNNKSIATSCSVIVKTRGTRDFPYLINSVEDLIQFRDKVNNDNVNYGNKFYKLTTDLDFIDQLSWIPIGNNLNNSFTGFFDGNGKTIKNIRIGTAINVISIENAGLFGVVQGGEIKDITINWAISSSYAKYSGGIVGKLSGGILNNCKTIGYLTSKSEMSYSGGIVGTANSSIISNCNSNADVTSVYSSGGIAGEIMITNIINCYSTGNITSTSNTDYRAKSGGIVGRLQNGKIINSYSSGDINSTNAIYDSSHSGGIAGICEGSIENCYSVSKISSYYSTTYTFSKEATFSGGIIGKYISGNVSNCIAINKSITANNSFNIADAFAHRIGSGLSDLNSSNNYADKSIIVKKNNKNITAFVNNWTDGNELIASPLILLNKYVELHQTIDNINLLKWKIESSTNDGHPIFQ